MIKRENKSTSWTRSYIFRVKTKQKTVTLKGMAIKREEVYVTLQEFYLYYDKINY